jgi:hypothetical protein
VGRCAPHSESLYPGKDMEELSHYLEDDRYEKAFESILKDIGIAKEQNDIEKVKRLINYLMSVTKLIIGETEQVESSPDMAKSEVSQRKMIYCSFCGKSKNEVLKMIAGPSVFICSECIALCQDILNEEIGGSKSD